MTQTERRRHQLIVDKRLQTKIMVCGAALPLTILVMVTFILGYYLWFVTDTSGVQLPYIGTLCIVLSGFVILGYTFVILNLIQLSHRVAGPIFNIHKTLDAIHAGDTDRRVQLRKDDYLKKIQDDLNDHLDWQEERQSTKPDPAHLSRALP